MLARSQVDRIRIELRQAQRRLPEVAFTYYPSGFVDKSSGLDNAAFVAEVDKIVQAAQADGSLARISRKFFDRDYIPEAAAYAIEAIDQEVR